MKEEELEKFVDGIFADKQLDEVSSNFDYLVMQKIQNETLQISAKPIISPFKWVLIGLFVVGIITAGFFFNTGSNSGNISKIRNLFDGIFSADLNYITIVGIIVLGLFILIQVVFLKNLHKKSLAQ